MSDNTAMLPSVRIQRAVAQTKDGIDASEACFICQKKLWLSVFFDEPEHDAEQERGAETLTNIGKLYHAHEPTNAKRGIYRLYHNGLGVAFKESRAARDATAKGGAKDEAEKIAQEKINEVGLGEGKKSLNPKNWGPDLLGLIAKLGIEAVPWLRDNALVTQVALSGVNTRVNDALARFDEIVKAQTLPVTGIQTAVFGSGLGGAAARLFLNKLIAKCRTDGDTLYYPMANGEAVLQLPFLGLLDCISSKAESNPVTDFLAGKVTLGMATLRVDGPMGVSRAVSQTVHYVAGHEVRLTRRVDSIAKAQGSYDETVLPGSHLDITGGYANRVQGRSNQLARQALIELHGKAYGAGVPVRSMEGLRAADIYLYNDFQFTHKVAAHGTEVGARGLSRYYGVTEGSLAVQLIAHMSRFVSWMRLRADTPEHPRRPPQTAYDLVDKQISRLRSTVNHPKSTYRLSKEELCLLRAWAEPMALDPPTMAMFDEFVHDELCHSKFDLAGADLAHNGYFKLRGIDVSDEVEAKNKTPPSPSIWNRR